MIEFEIPWCDRWCVNWRWQRDVTRLEEGSRAVASILLSGFGSRHLLWFYRKVPKSGFTRLQNILRVSPLRAKVGSKFVEWLMCAYCIPACAIHISLQHDSVFFLLGLHPGSKNYAVVRQNDKAERHVWWNTLSKVILCLWLPLPNGHSVWKVFCLSHRGLMFEPVSKLNHFYSPSVSKSYGINETKLFSRKLIFTGLNSWQRYLRVLRQQVSYVMWKGMASTPSIPCHCSLGAKAQPVFAHTLYIHSFQERRRIGNLSTGSWTIPRASWASQHVSFVMVNN